jgi:lipopolysaccharide biosynthesis regulator YciM
MLSSLIDLLWFLLPVAAASGWYAGRREGRRSAARTTERESLPEAYFRGLNFLLNEQQDKAIEVFIKMLEVNSETVETHLALGNLFRRRGEVERAIRIHQNLIARPALDREQRSLALLELGQDYLKAGLFDRAENLFTELVENRMHGDQSLRLLLHIYQQEKEWEKAIATSQRLARLTGQSMDVVIAHYHCELAQAAIDAHDFRAARQQLRKALASDANCVRATILLGDVEAAEHRDPEAIRTWKRVEEQDPVFLGEVARRIADAYRRLNDPGGLYEYFEGAKNRERAVPLMLELANLIRDRDGIDAAERFVVEWLRRYPSVQGLKRLIELNMLQAEGRAREDLTLLKGIIEKLAEQRQGYACQQCGFRGRSLYWMCPSCNQWNTIKPVDDTVAGT